MSKEAVSEAGQETPYQEALYNEAILALAAGLKEDDLLDRPDATARVDSPLCGSRIRVDITLDADGRIAEYGQQVRACALGRSSAAIMKAHAVGRSRAELVEIHDRVEAMLKRGGDPPGGDWADLAVLRPAKAHKSRHASILLPFKAVVKAIEGVAGAARAGTDGRWPRGTGG